MTEIWKIRVVGAAVVIRSEQTLLICAKSLQTKTQLSPSLVSLAGTYFWCHPQPRRKKQAFLWQQNTGDLLSFGTQQV